MLQEVGALGCLIVTALIVFEVTRVLTGMDLIFSESAAFMAGATEQVQLGVKVGITLAITIVYGLIAQSLGRPMFVFLLLIMIPLATTELGTDSWISELMEPEMARLGLAGGWVLVYTSAIMMILRFFAGPIVHKLSPLGLLAASAVVAACGLVFLSKATGVTILAAATLYGFGKTFFWPTMLGVVAEQFPKGGALTLNTTGGVGMLGVGVVGAALLGNIQDKTIDDQLAKADPALHAEVVDQAGTERLRHLPAARSGEGRCPSGSRTGDDHRDPRWREEERPDDCRDLPGPDVRLLSDPHRLLPQQGWLRSACADRTRCGGCRVHRRRRRPHGGLTAPGISLFANGSGEFLFGPVFFA